MRRGIRSDPSTDKMIIRRYTELKSVFLVAKGFGCSHTHVIRILKRHNIPRGPSGKLAQVLKDIANLKLREESILVPTKIANGLHARMKLRFGMKITRKREGAQTRVWRIG